MAGRNRPSHDSVIWGGVIGGQRGELQSFRGRGEHARASRNLHRVITDASGTRRIGRLTHVVERGAGERARVVPGHLTLRSGGCRSSSAGATAERAVFVFGRRRGCGSKKDEQVSKIKGFKRKIFELRSFESFDF